MSDSTKKTLLELIEKIWDSEEFKLSDTERTRTLRSELLKRLLSSVMTDDERATLNGLSSGCRMRENSKILMPENLVCGDHVWIGENVIVDASGGLEIGSHTTFGSGSFIWSHTSAMANIFMENVSRSQYNLRAKTKIGSGTFIGGPSVIYPGVTIGNRCIIMPLSAVNSDVPDNTMVGGAPAKFIKMIDDAYIERFKVELARRQEQS